MGQGLNICAFSSSMVRVCVSGYFDPLHVGHIEYMEKAKTLGDRLIVIVNNDEQARQKKGKAFMPCDERVRIIKSLRIVAEVYMSVDADRTVCESLALIRPDVFCNGGDQNNHSIPEARICEKLEIKLVDGLGDKIQSSSWLVEGAMKKGSHAC